MCYGIPYIAVMTDRMEQKNYTYIVECSDGKLYTGWTTCIEKRMNEHNSGSGAKFTRARLPVKLRYFEVFETKSDAMKREAAIKKLSRQQKEQLIALFQYEKIQMEKNEKSI